MIFESNLWKLFEVIQFNNLDKKEDSSMKQSKLASVDSKQKENNMQVDISFLIV